MLLEEENNNSKQDLDTQETKEMSSQADELLSLKEKFCSLAADFDNYKKRIEKEKKSWLNFAKIDVIKAFLPFLDEMSLAVESLKTQENENCEKTLEGFSLILQNYQKKIFELGVSEVKYDSFDPEYHEAIGFSPNEKLSDGSIATIVKKGFLLDNQILRYAQVIVVKNN